WSTWGTPKFKLLCEDGCKALGTFGGVCVVTPNKACQQTSKIFQCQCSNYCYRSNPVTSNGKQ
ncbi:mytimacin 6, partial [Biomphalaria pfeifferi]